MDLFRNFGWLFIAILVLLVLLVAVLVVIYDQNGLFLPFASQPDSASLEALAVLPKEINEFLSITSRRII